jgi:hypothetical protein
MLANKIIDRLITIIAWVILPIQIVTTFILGILVELTFGFLLIPFSLIWIIFFFGPLLVSSYVYNKVPYARPLVAIFGIPLAVIGNIYVCLLPSMGEMESRIVKLLYCQTWPATWYFHQFYNRKLQKNSDGLSELSEVLERISRKDVTIKQYLCSILNKDQNS